MAGFELKHFTPEQLAKLSALNPHLSQELGVRDKEDSEALLLEALRLNTESWIKLETALHDEKTAYEKYVKAKKGKPLFEKGEILAALLFFCLLLLLI